MAKREDSRRGELERGDRWSGARVWLTEKAAGGGELRRGLVFGKEMVGRKECALRNPQKMLKLSKIGGCAGGLLP